MKNRSAVGFFIIIILVLSTFSCITNTNVIFESNVDGAELFIDGQYSGLLPVNVTMSNAVWEDPNIRVEKEGYYTARYTTEKVIQPVNLIVGATIWYPSLLWCYGPDSYQYIEMFPEQ